MLRAHRLSTVIPTEAFWMNGTSLHRVTPNGQSSARSWRETGTPVLGSERWNKRVAWGGHGSAVQPTYVS